MTLSLESIKTNKRYSDHIRRYDSYRNDRPEDLARLSYGDLRGFSGEPLNGDYYIPELMSGSDYVNGSVTVSNHRVFLEDFGKLNGVHDVYGGYGTYAVAIRLDAITPEMLEVFEALEDYPLISEDDHSEVEMQSQDEAWQSWAKHDFTKELTAKFPALEEKINEMPDEELFLLFYALADRANEYWENETGNSAWIRLERVAAVATEEDITRPYGDTDLSGKLF